MVDKLLPYLREKGIEFTLPKRSHNPAEPYHKLLEATLRPKNGELVTQLIIAEEGWGLWPLTTQARSSDFGGNNVDDADAGGVIQEMIDLFTESPIALVVQIQEGHELVHQLYQKNDDQYYQICTRFTYDFSNPIRYEGKKMILDLKCDEVKVYTANPDAKVRELSEQAKSHLAEADTPTTMRSQKVISNLNDIQPIKQTIEFIT